jgi:hypothetical protein
MGLYPIYINELIFLMSIGAVFSGLGAILANNFIKLKGGE